MYLSNRFVVGKRPTRLVALLIVVIAVIANLPAAFADTYITGVTAQATSSQSTGPNTVVSDNGLTETAPGSGVFQLTTNQYTPPDGAFWNSGSLPGNTSFPDQNPYIQFNLGATYTVDRFHVWNYNGDGGYNFRGFKDTTIQYSLDGTTWKTIAQRFRFAQGPGVNTYTGEDYTLTYPVSARYIRFQADSTYRNFGPVIYETAGLGKVRFHAGGVVKTPPATGGVFPSDSGVVNVKYPPYNAKGDGVADDTDALAQAISDWQGTRQTIYLPAGTYKVSRSLKLEPRGAGFTNFRGESSSKTIIKLADSTFTDPANAKPVLSAANNRVPGGGISADWFNNNFGNFTIDTGIGNAGAVGLQFYANNVGAVRNVVIRSGDSSGEIALDLGYDDQNGPLFAKNITTDGFKIGVRMAASVNSQTLENVTIKNPSVVGIENGGQCVSIRNLTFSGNVSAVNNYGFLTLVVGNLTCTCGASSPAILNEEGLFVRGVNTTGYTKAIQNNYGDKASVTGPNISEFSSQTPLSLFPTRANSLKLTVKDTPDAPSDSVSTWANVRNFRLVTDPDDTAAVQRAIDSGASTVYFPGQGNYYLASKVILRGNVRRIVGMQAQIFSAGTGGGFQVEAGTPPTVWMEDMGLTGGSVDLVNNSSRVLVCRNLQDLFVYPQGSGDLYLENVAIGALTVNGQKVWARQLNIERVDPKVTNNGGTLWILGMKAEDGGTLIKTTGGGKSELLGGLYYSLTGNLAPMFINVESSVSFSVGEVNFSYNPFLELVRETRNGVTRTLTRDNTPQRRYVPGSMLPLYVGYYDPAYLAPPYNVQAIGGDRSVSLTWDAMPGALSYTVRRSTSAAGPFTTLATITANSYVNTGLTAGTTYYYTISAKYAGGNSAQSAPVAAAANVLYRVNCGGSAAGAFASDKFFSGGNTAFFGNAIDLSGVTEPAPASVYQSFRWGNFTYQFTGLTPGASYKVRLHFAETYFTNPGQRIFSVQINGTPALTDFDIIAAAGAPNKALVREFTLPADASGAISLTVSATVDNAAVSGLELRIP